jgi:molecular chaperone GrpE
MSDTKQNQREEPVPKDSAVEEEAVKETAADMAALEQEAAENGAADAQPDCEKSPKERIAELEAQLIDANDQFLRKAAEFDNFRKRMNQQKQEAIDFANQSLLLDLIQIIDDFERAIKSAETSKDFTTFHEGISMIEKRLLSQLENKWGLKRFDSIGEPFDPNRHEAIMMEKSADIDEAVVQEDFVKGYILKDRVVRSAKVKVLMPESGA